MNCVEQIPSGKKMCKARGWIFNRSLHKGESINYYTYYKQKYSLENYFFKWKPCKLAKPPKPRFKHSAVVYNNQLFIIGGQESDTSRFNDVHRFSPSTKKFRLLKVRGPSSRFSRHTSVIIGDRVINFGGYDGISQYFDLSFFYPETSLWEFPVSVSGDIPESRVNHAACALGKSMYLWGGNKRDEDGRYRTFEDFYRFDTENFTWEKIQARGDFPTSRSGHCLVSIKNKIYLFGGGIWTPMGWIKKYNTVHLYDTETNEWSLPKVHGDKVDASTFAIPFTIGSFLFIYGGGSLSQQCVLDTLYVLDTISFTWTKLKIYPKSDLSDFPGRDMGTASILENDIWVFGGYAGGPIDKDHFARLQFKIRGILQEPLS